MKSTYSLGIITDTLCRDDAEVQVVHLAFKHVLHYQWAYQSASSRQFRDVKESNKRCVEQVLEMLNDQGQGSVSEQLEHVFYHSMDESTLTKSKVLTKVKQIMKVEVLKCSSITESRYNNDFAQLMKEAFLEYCNEFPLTEAPFEYDTIFCENMEPGWDYLSGR